MRVSVINFGGPTAQLAARPALALRRQWGRAPGSRRHSCPASRSTTPASLLAATALFALVNTLVRPFAYLASACLIVLTFGLFIVVINALMLALTAWLAGQLDLGFRVNDFPSAIFGALLIAFVSFGAYARSCAHGRLG